MYHLLDPKFHPQIETIRQGSPDLAGLFYGALYGQSLSWALAHFDKLDLLDDMLPELAFCRGVTQNPFHHLPVFEHTLLVLAKAEQIADRPEDLFGPDPKLCDAVRKNRIALRLSALGHDLGKPETRTKKQDGYYSFYGHDKVSARIFMAMCERLKFNDDAVTLAELLIHYHMHPGPVAHRFLRKEAGLKAVRRIITRFGENWPAAMALSLADSFGTKGPLAIENAENELLAFVPVLLQTRKEFDGQSARSMPITGREVMEHFSLAPGKKVGAFLKQAQTLFAENPSWSGEQILAQLEKLNFS